ncbi:unnamed protein product [Oikopleura dioica]|uniref:Uncharacterized protein n=1 Tax=Oikopleura dioica TaxID=34765 RepID=E4XTE9_OIKDI|nr:unnamed protein product [Oikopleura dioica]
MRLLISAFLSVCAAQDNEQNCGDLSVLATFCSTINGTISKSEKGSFCLNDRNKTVGASFSFCNSSTVDVHNITDLQLLDFRSESGSDCPLRNNSDLTNALQLSSVTLSLNCSCPGALTVKDFSTNTTKTFAAWKTEDHITLPYRQCVGQQSFCSFQQTDSPFNNYTCPENSRCVDAGPGVFDCQEIVQQLQNFSFYKTFEDFKP